MIGTAILLVFLLIATVTDVRSRKIYNWTTYPGILIAFGFHGIASLIEQDADDEKNPVTWFATIGLGESLIGFLLCGGLMIVCYVFFAGGVGGGDIKLIAMMGAWLGRFEGTESLLWTFVLAACLALIVLTWKYGLWYLVIRTTKYVLYWLRLGGRFPLTDAEREPLQQSKLFLAPAALAAVVIVEYRFIELFG